MMDSSKEALTRVKMPILPYDSAALEPVLSKLQVQTHFFKHHLKYYTDLMKLISETELQRCYDAKHHLNNFRQLSRRSVCQLWYHDLYWNSLGFNKQLSSFAKSTIERDFGSVQQLITRILAVGKESFASGYVTVGVINRPFAPHELEDVKNKVRLEVRFVKDCEIYSSNQYWPLLVIDVWQHSFYLDYVSSKTEYLEKIVTILNWSTLSDRLELYCEGKELELQ